MSEGKKKGKTKKERLAERKKAIDAGELDEAALAKKQKKRKKTSSKPAVEPSISSSLEPEFKPLKPEDMRIVKVPVDCIHRNPDNPNEMDDATFSVLVNQVKKTGFRDPLNLFLLPEDDERVIEARANGDKRPQYELEGGEHRVEAMKVLRWKEAPAIVDTNRVGKDERDALLVANNIIKGDMSPEKFTRLFERLQPKYGEEMVSQMMGFADAETMREYIIEAENNLPTEEMKKEFRKKKKDIKTMEDISRVVNQIFAKFGSTVKLNYMFMEYGGQTHVVVWMDGATKNIVEEITTACAENELDINKVLQRVLASGWDKEMIAVIGEEASSEKREQDADDEQIDFEEDDDDLLDDDDDE